jgi:phenylalanyl-tRNA synthetase alpha chain
MTSEEITNTKNEAISQILKAQNTSELEELRITYLGRQGKLTGLIKRLKEVPTEKRRQVGILINEAKNTLVEMLASQKNKFSQSAKTWFDPTIPGTKPKIGHLHLVTQAIDEISKTFEQIGFIRARYPETEWDWNAFGSLNFGPWHPARDEWETFIVDTKAHPKLGPIVLTPHTSSGQVREMKRVKIPPIRMINIAKCYRRQSDASHLPMFHQFEGLVIDKEISLVHLKGTLDYFARNFFGKGRKTRLRPYNFPFTEPSFEFDISCDICGGKGCKVCKEGWLELGGAGMVHPQVLQNGGIDPKKYTGFAFGWGVERVMMMKSGLKLPDIRLIYSSDLRFLTQF